MGLVGSGAAIVWFIWRRPEDFAVVTEIGLTTAAIIIGLQVVQLLVTALTHRFVLREVTGRTIDLRSWIEMFVVARFLNTFVPQGGNAYRATRLRFDYGIPLTSYIAAFLTFMWLLTEFNLLVAAFAVSVDPATYTLAGMQASLVLAGAAILLVIGPLTAAALIRRLSPANGRGGWLVRRTDLLLTTATEAFSTPVSVRGGLLHVALTSAIAIAVVWAAFLALGTRLRLAEVLLFYAIAQVGTFVPVTPGNAGVQELAFGVVASASGLGLAEGILVSALLRVTGAASLVLVAVPLGGLRAAARFRAEGTRRQPDS